MIAPPRGLPFSCFCCISSYKDMKYQTKTRHQNRSEDDKGVRIYFVLRSFGYDVSCEKTIWVGNVNVVPCQLCLAMSPPTGDIYFTQECLLIQSCPIQIQDHNLTTNQTTSRFSFGCSTADQNRASKWTPLLEETFNLDLSNFVELNNHSLNYFQFKTCFDLHWTDEDLLRDLVNHGKPHLYIFLQCLLIKF